MSILDVAATEYRNLPLAVLTESATNPRRTFEDAALKELAESIRSQGVLSPLLVRPLNERSFEIVFGARRYRAAQIAEAATVPVRIAKLTDAQALEAQLVENLVRRDVHPMEEAQGFAALLRLDEPKYSIDQIAARTGKSPAFVAQRLKLTELVPSAVDAFYQEEIGVGHALLLARLQPEQQEQALASCFREEWAGAGNKPRRILLPIRHLQEWIETHVLLILKDAPFDKKDAALLPEAGSCLHCPKRTGHNKLLFEGMTSKQDACTSPDCYQAKVAAHVQKTLAAKPKLVQISTIYRGHDESSAALQPNRYVEIRQTKPEDKQQRDWPEYKTCKFVSEAVITDGSGKGELRKVCANPDCPIHHPKKKANPADAKFKAEQEKRHREEALAQATGLRVLGAIVSAVPVRLMKRDLLFVAEQLLPLLDDQRRTTIARRRGIKGRDGESTTKLLSTLVRKADESTLGGLLVEITILLSRTPMDAGKALTNGAQLYKVDTNAITLKVKQEFAAKEKAKAVTKGATVSTPHPAKKTA